MEYIEKAIKSRTVWTIIIMFVIGGIQAIEPFMSPQVFAFINGALSLVAVHFRISPKQDFSKE